MKKTKFHLTKDYLIPSTHVIRFLHFENFCASDRGGRTEEWEEEDLSNL